MNQSQERTEWDAGGRRAGQRAKRRAGSDCQHARIQPICGQLMHAADRPCAMRCRRPHEHWRRRPRRRSRSPLLRLQLHRRSSGTSGESGRETGSAHEANPSHNERVSAIVRTLPLRMMRAIRQHDGGCWRSPRMESGGGAGRGVGHGLFAVVPRSSTRRAIRSSLSLSLSALVCLASACFVLCLMKKKQQKKTKKKGETISLRGNCTRSPRRSPHSQAHSHIATRATSLGFN